MENAAQTNWKVDVSHSEIEFKVKHMMISTVTGSFADFDADVETDNDQFNNAKFSFSANVDSINTKNKDRDAHLNSEEFFNSEKYAQLTFRSRSFDGEKLVGDLTIKDVTKEVTLQVDFNGIAVDPYGQTKAGFEMTGNINRKDFNLTWNAVTEAGNVVVSENVKLIANLQFIKQ